MTASWEPGTYAAIASAIAAALSAWSAVRGPRREEKRQLRHARLSIFNTIMQEKETINSLESVRALNILDIVYADKPKVREAWAELYSVFETAGDEGPHPQIRKDKTNALLKEMSVALGLSKKLKASDFARTYFPRNLAKDLEIQSLQQDIELRKLRQQFGNAASGEELLAKFPPKPS